MTGTNIRRVCKVLAVIVRMSRVMLVPRVVAGFIFIVIIWILMRLPSLSTCNISTN